MTPSRVPFTVRVGDNAGSGDLDVGRFQIAVNDAVLMRCFERIGNLMRDVQGLTDGDRPPGDPLGERVAVDELEYERGRTIPDFEPVDGADVRMVQRGQQPRLALEADAPLGIGREETREDFDRDIAPELPVACPIHLAHATHA